MRGVSDQTPVRTSFPPCGCSGSAQGMKAKEDLPHFPLVNVKKVWCELKVPVNLDAVLTGTAVVDNKMLCNSSW